MATYRELEKAVDAGLIRHIGTSNMTPPKMELLLADARIKPAANQMEMHPTFAQTGFFTYLKAKEILPIAFCPVGSPGRPARDTDPSDVEVLTHPVVKAVAEAHGVHPAVIAVKWAAQRGQLPIPASIHREKYLSNLKAVVGDPLTADEMARMAAVDCNSRLIKGQVFLWPGADSWRDLWDADGVIAQ
jgi:diketogulonate reductase-like aldo/keto reductase